MEHRQVHEWDVLEHPDFTAWLDELRQGGWYRVSGVSGVKAPSGTVGYLFQYLEPAALRGA